MSNNEGEEEKGEEDKKNNRIEPNPRKKGEMHPPTHLYLRRSIVR